MENAAVGGGRRRGATKHSAEDQALDQIAKEVSFIHHQSWVFFGFSDKCEMCLRFFYIIYK